MPTALNPYIWSLFQRFWVVIVFLPSSRTSSCLLSLNEAHNHIQQSSGIQLCYCGSQAPVEIQVVCYRCRLLVLHRKPTLLPACEPTCGFTLRTSATCIEHLGVDTFEMESAGEKKDRCIQFLVQILESPCPSVCPLLTQFSVLPLYS